MTNMAPIVLSTVHVHPLLRHVTKSVGCVRVNLVTKEVTVLLISMNAVWESRVQLTPIASTLQDLMCAAVRTGMLALTVYV